jgi:hypothetical protein
MRGKLWFVGGLAAGFVLGARAGREKYNDLVRNARKVLDHPTVQEAAGVVQAQTSRLYAEGKETVSDKLSHTRLGEKLGTRGLGDQDALAGSKTGNTSGGDTPPASGGTSSTTTNNTNTF